MARATDARRVALDILDGVLDRGRPLDEAFAGHPRLDALSERDRAFARLLATTVLRRRGQIDALLEPLVRRTPKDGRVLNALRLGLAQLVFLGTPPHAAVGETVALAEGGQRAARGLINAVLRRAASEAEALIATQDAERLTLPDWLWQAWRAAYGEPTTRALCRAHWPEPPRDLTIKHDLQIWSERLDATPIHGHSVRAAAGGPIERLPGYGEGAWWVQDAAAALPARLLGELAGQPVLDLCAAPGGKTAQLAAAGARVVAVELSAPRAERLHANLTRLRLDAEVVIADVLAWRPAAPAARILLDTPCTATGTIRRHPDIAWHKTTADVARMAALQGHLLAAAAAMLAPGGVLVYAACTLQPEEGPVVIERALAADPSLERLPVRPAEIDHLPIEHTAAGDLRTLPCHLADQGGLDGFFIARLRRLA